MAGGRFKCKGGRCRKLTLAERVDRAFSRGLRWFFSRPALVSAAYVIFVVLVLFAASCLGSENFIAITQDANLKAEIESTAERARHDLAVEWFGEAIPANWSQPCRIQVSLGGGAGGATSFYFQGGEVIGWQMSVQGTRERLLDSVIPHEVLHTVFATYFRQPLPRWLDEGACTVVETEEEHSKQREMLIQFLRTGRGIPFSTMLTMTEYPSDIMPLYSQGYSATSFLLEHSGKQAWTTFVYEGLQDKNWPGAIKKHYGFESVGQFQEAWLGWVKAGSPPRESGVMQVASYAGGECGPRWTPRGWVQVCPNPQQQQPATQPPLVSVPPKQEQQAKCKECDCDLEAFKAEILALIDNRIQQAISQLPDNGNAIASVEVSQIIPGGLILTYEDGTTKDVQLPPIYPQWVDSDGNVIDSLPGGVRLGQTMPLRIEARIIDAINARTQPQ